MSPTVTTFRLITQTPCHTPDTSDRAGRLGCSHISSSARALDEGDGVINCNDKCNGVDDTVFAPECEDAIPTTSVWGLIVLTLLLLAGGKTFFGIGVKRVARS